MQCVRETMRAMEQRAVRAAWPLTAMTVALVALMVFLSAGREDAFDTALYGLLAVAEATVGALIVSRRGGHRVGWVLLAMGVLTGVWEALEGWGHYAADNDLRGGVVGDWVIQWSWIVDLALIGLLLLWFPTGRLPGRRWRAGVWGLGAGMVLAWVGQALNPAIGVDLRAGENPVGVDGLPADALFAAGTLLLLGGIGAGIASLVVRFRRSAQLQRQQLKWLALAAAVILVASALGAAFWSQSVLAQVGVAVTLPLLPGAVGVAILRYRLYDIDLVVNRTLVYGALTAILAGVYAGAVLLFQLVLSPSSDLAVAGSTLVVAALFRPLRARLQSAVDRRFFRRKYDAQATLQAFAARLRDQVTLDAVDAELRDVVAETMQPAHVSLWLRRAPVPARHLTDRRTTPAIAAATPTHAMRGSRSWSRVTASVTVTMVNSEPSTETTVRSPSRVAAA